MSFDPTIIQPGTLKHQVTIQAPSSTRDTAGQPGVTWTTVLTTRAAIEGTASLTFKFSFQNSTLAANATDCITIRYPAVPIAPGMQVLFGDNAYIVQAVDDVNRRHRVLILACVGVDTLSS
jgi:SPP1 family predicted phage head-tail adaptor